MAFAVPFTGLSPKVQPALCVRAPLLPKLRHSRAVRRQILTAVPPSALATDQENAAQIYGCADACGDAGAQFVMRFVPKVEAIPLAGNLAAFLLVRVIHPIYTSVYTWMLPLLPSCVAAHVNHLATGG
jgi:hypothetical protein